MLRVTMHSHSLKNHFLIAMPTLADNRFAKTVTYICEHNEGGAMGIVINQPASISHGELFSQLKLGANIQNDFPLLLGGPVKKERGFVLHSADRHWASTMSVSADISITGSKDILEDIANNNGPKDALIALGYAGWSTNQLEKEIADNSWLTVPANKEIIFHTPIEKRWESSAQQLGIDLHLLSSQAGHA
ncbi:YqgE/AlgH family protein [Eionea flava]